MEKQIFKDGGFLYSDTVCDDFAECISIIVTDRLIITCDINIDVDHFNAENVKYPLLFLTLFISAKTQLLSGSK